MACWLRSWVYDHLLTDYGKQVVHAVPNATNAINEHAAQAGTWYP